MSHTLHSLQESVLINERNLDNGLPVLLFAVHVQIKVIGVEIFDRRCFFDNQVLKTIHIRHLS